MRTRGWFVTVLGAALLAGGGGVAGQGRGTPTQQPAQPQKPPPPLVTTGLIVGRVVDAATGRPVAGASVQLGGGVPSAPAPVPAGGVRPGQTPPAPPPRFMTDGEGRFAFRHLTRGNYNISAGKAGYAEGAYGRFRANGPSRPIQLVDSERVGELTIRLFKFAVITGTVLDEAGEPVVGAQLRAYRRVLQSGRRVLTQSGSIATDDRGVYRFSNLLPGEYVIALPMVSSSVPAGFTNDGRNQNLQLTMNTPGGTNVGGGGRPVTPDGRFLLQSSTGGSLSYFGSPDPAGRVLAYPTQYYSSAGVASQATVVKLASGEERANVDFAMRLVPTSNISGMLMGPEGPADHFVLRLVPSDSDEMSFDPDVATAVTDQTGGFMFLAVPAGQYVLQTSRVAQPQPPMPPPPPGATLRTEQRAEPNGTTTVTTTYVSATGAVLNVDRRTLAPPMLWTATPVVVGEANIDGLTLTLREGFKVSGRVEFVGSGERPPVARLVSIPVVIEPADARQRTNFQQPGRLNPDGTFTVGGLLPGKYLVRIGGSPGGWTTQSVMLGGVDVADAPFELNERDAAGVVVTFTDRISDLRGTVRGLKADDEPPAVIVFPSDSIAWKNYGINPRRMRMTRTSATGTFAFGPMPPGDYFLAAVPDEYSSEWNDPAYLEVLARVATRFSIGDGERKTQEVEIQNVRPPGGGAVLAAPAVHPVAMPDASRLSDEGRNRGPFVPDQVPPPPPPPVPPVPPSSPAGQVRDRAAPDPVGTGSIAGVVLDDTTKRPLRRVRVSARTPEMRNEQLAMTDEEGRFVIADLPPGPHTIVGTKPAYLTSWLGATRPGRGPGIPLSLKEGQKVTDVTLHLARGGVITGVVMDQFGQPFAGGRIRLMQVQKRDGERVIVSSGGSGVMTTDDRGMYRAYGLTPATYVVGVMPPTTGTGSEVRLLSDSEMRAALADLARKDATPPPPPPTAGGAGANAGDMGRVIPPAPAGPRPETPLGGRALNFATVYYPGTVIDTDATPITLAAGQEVNGVDFTLQLVPTSRVEGAVLLPDGQPAARAQVQLWTSLAGSTSNTSVRIMPDGKFQAIGVAPGKYSLIARLTESGSPGVPPPPPPPGGVTMMAPMPGQQPPGPTYWAQQDLVLSGEDVTGLVMTLVPTPSVSGRVVLESRAGTPLPDQATIRVTLETFGPSRAGVSSRSVTADRAGAFLFAGVAPGTYRINSTVASNPPQPIPWIVRSALLDGRDVFDQPLDVQSGRSVQGVAVTLADQGAELAGSITDPSGSPVPGLQVLLFPTNRAEWSTLSRRMRGPSRPGLDGMFRFGGVRAGEYYLAVVTELEPGDWGDPAFMEQVAAAALKLTFTEGEKKVQNLRTGG